MDEPSATVGAGDPGELDGESATRAAGRSARRGARQSAQQADGEPVGESAREPDAESLARAIALRQLTAAPRSRAQLAEAMARRDVPEEVADRVLDRFTEVGLIDDAEYARMVVRTRHAERGLSRRAIAMELRRRGVAEDDATPALDQIDADDEESAARELVRRKLRSTSGLDAATRMRRTQGTLGRKGYPPGLVARLVREELAAEGVEVDDDASVTLS